MNTPPLSPACVPPTSGPRGLPTKSKFLTASMRTRLLSIANQFVDFLDQEPLNKAGFINNDFFFKFLDQAMAKTAKRLEQDGKKIGITDILTIPESRNALSRTSSNLFASKLRQTRSRNILLRF